MDRMGRIWLSVGGEQVRMREWRPRQGSTLHASASKADAPAIRPISSGRHDSRTLRRNHAEIEGCTRAPNTHRRGPSMLTPSVLKRLALTLLLVGAVSGPALL